MLELKNITKKFPGVVALDDVSIAFYPGEIHALLGENGAGKSTLMNIIAGNYAPDKGKVFIDGQEIVLRSYQDAIKNNISIVNQEIQVIPDSSVAENIMLDKLKHFTKAGKINWSLLNDEAEKYQDMVGLKVEPKTPIYRLSAAQKQLCQIAKALSSDAKYLLLDEPTSSLTMHETERLFTLLKKIRDNGVTVLFVSHKIEEVLYICDKATVLRDGRYISTGNCGELTKPEIVKMMIGRDTDDVYLGSLGMVREENILEVRDLCREGMFEHINMRLKKGEILGFYGLVGSGRTELAKILIGEDKKTSGEVLIKGKKAEIRNVSDSLYKYGMGYVSENRKEEGLILDFPITDNITVTTWRRLQNRLKFLSPHETDLLTQDMIEKLDVRTPGFRQVVGKLSGGNQQKICIGKWLAAECEILIIDEPTVGVDVGAKEQIHELIWKLANEYGTSVILISSEMPEIVKLARRILVFNENKIVGELDDLDHYKGQYQLVSKRIGEFLS
jgi:ribose transport system ATP-binding protein